MVEKKQELKIQGPTSAPNHLTQFALSRQELLLQEAICVVESREVEARFHYLASALTLR